MLPMKVPRRGNTNKHERKKKWTKLYYLFISDLLIL